jgi:FkbH-like protein
MNPPPKNAEVGGSIEKIENILREEKSLSENLTIGFVGNIITKPFSKISNDLGELGGVEVIHLGFGQVVEALDGVQAFDALIVHLDHRWFFDVAPDVEALARADDLVRRVEARLERAAGAVVLNSIPFLPESSVDNDLHNQIETLAAIHQRLFDLARRHERVSIVDAAGVAAKIGYSAALRERNRYIMQFPYAPTAVSALAKAYAEAVKVRLRARRKVIVLDADNTLWGGVVGEDGVEGIQIDQEYPGVIYHTFQRQLARLRALGVLLCAVTKNNEADFLEVFQRRVMPLKLDDFVAYRANWIEKSDNIREMAAELKLGLDSFIFIDDNPFEIEEVRARLPDVECHVFPKDTPESILGLLAGIETLRSRSLTAEDLSKTEQYQTEARRQSLLKSAVSFEDYLASLEIELHISVNNPAHVRRVAQLTNKTNQFNLTTQRYTEGDIEFFMATGQVYACRLVDQFGDMGIVGVAIVIDGVIDSFLMSCRALGRKVEGNLLAFLCTRQAGHSLAATYLPTAKNAMVETFYEENGFALVEVSQGVKSYRFNGGPSDAGHVTIVEF